MAAAPKDVLCKGQNNGGLELAAQGGTPGYNITWSGPANYTGAGSTLNNLYAGIYTASVTDAAGCVKTSRPANEPATELSLALPAIADTICFRLPMAQQRYLPMGALRHTVIFGMSTVATAQLVSGLSSAEYAVTVTDANNCPASAQTFIFQKGELFGYAEARSPSCNAGSDGIGIVTGVFYAIRLRQCECF